MLRIILSVLFITTIIFSVTAQVQQINPQLELVPIQDVISYFNEHANSPTSSGTLIDSFLSWISEKQQTVSTVNNANLVPPAAAPPAAAPPAAAPIAANVDNNLPVVAAPIVPVTTVHPEQPTQNLPPTVPETPSPSAPATEAPTGTSPATTGVATTTATSTMPSASTIRNSTTTMSASRTTTGTTTTTTPPRTNAASILQINNAHNVLTTIALGLIFVSMIYL